jgi:hypothetical protein
LSGSPRLPFLPSCVVPQRFAVRIASP